MPRDIIASKIIEKILKHPRVCRMNPGSVKNAISEIHKENPGISMNAASYLFGLTKRFSVYKSLTAEDKKSLQFQKSIATSSKTTTRSPRPKRPEIAPDFESPFISEANDNAEAYVYVYLLENGLRKTIIDKFGSSTGWWTDHKKVPEDIQNEARRIQNAERKYPWLKEREGHPIYYVGIYDLFRIIELSWKSDFKEVFKDLENLRAWIKESVPIRNYVAHNIKTRQEERQNIRIKTDYICRLISRWQNPPQTT